MGSSFPTQRRTGSYLLWEALKALTGPRQPLVALRAPFRLLVNGGLVDRVNSFSDVCSFAGD